VVTIAWYLKYLLNMKKIDEKEGLFFWITGLAGSGKSSIAKHLKSYVANEFGSTLLVSGDGLRNIFKFRKYSKKDRLKFSQQKLKFCKFILKQKINVIYSTISLFESVRRMNKAKISNYIEIYIEADLKKIIKLNKKKIYHKKNKENVWGIDLKPQFPKNPDIKIINNFDKSPTKLARELKIKISEFLKNK